MNWISKIPFVGDLLGKVFDRVWPDKSRHAELSMEIELEEARQSGGKMTPRKLLKYVIIGWIGLAIAAMGATAMFPEAGIPDFMLEKALWLAGVLFGFGG